MRHVEGRAKVSARVISALAAGSDARGSLPSSEDRAQRQDRLRGSQNRANAPPCGAIVFRSNGTPLRPLKRIERWRSGRRRGTRFPARDGPGPGTAVRHVPNIATPRFAVSMDAIPQSTRHFPHPVATHVAHCAYVQDAQCATCIMCNVQDVQLPGAVSVATQHARRFNAPEPRAGQHGPSPTRPSLLRCCPPRMRKQRRLGADAQPLGDPDGTASLDQERPCELENVVAALS